MVLDLIYERLVFDPFLSDAYFSERMVFKLELVAGGIVFKDMLFLFIYKFYITL